MSYVYIGGAWGLFSEGAITGRRHSEEESAISRVAARRDG